MRAYLATEDGGSVTSDELETTTAVADPPNERTITDMSCMLDESPWLRARGIETGRPILLDRQDAPRPSFYSG